MKTVNVLEARNNLSALLAEVERGEEIVIARRGHPVARLVAVQEPDHSGAALLRLVEKLRLEPREPRRSAAEIDAIVEDIRNSWD